MKKVIATLLCFVVFHFANAQTLLYESFENGFPTNWLNVDADYDGFSWQLMSVANDGVPAHTGDKSMVTYSYDNSTYSVLYPNNYLITSRLTIPSNGATLTFWRRALDASYPYEHYEVKISTTGTAVSNFTNTVYQETISSDTWIQRTVSLSAFAGQSIYIAFVHNNSYDQFAFQIDDIKVEATQGTPPDPQNYATIILECYDIWGDGTGYQILLDADAVEYANLPTYFTCGSSYAAYEYLLPTYAASNDWSVLLSGIDSIHIPAGIYDYVILNPGCADYSRIWIASDRCSPAKGDDFYFEGGRKYHFYITLPDSNDCTTLTIDGTPPVIQTKNVDLGVGFTDDQYLSYIDTLYVNYGDGVQPHFKVYNWGGNNPSENDYNDTLYVGITFNGADSGLVGWINYTDAALLIGYEQSFYFINDFLTPTQIANAGLLGGTYEMCLYLRLASGWVEQDPIDNTHCIDVIFLNNTVNNYTITATAGAGGTISPGGTNTYSEGANQTYTITPNTCYAIADVQVDGISVGAVSSYTFSNIQANHTIRATFTQLAYTVTVTAGANGSIVYGTYTVPAGTSQIFTINCGDQPSFVFVPANGYQVNDVLVNGTSVGSPISYQFPALTGNATLNVSFVEIPGGMFSIAASAGVGGTISPNGTNNYSQGSSQTFTITPNTCYAIADVKVDGISVGTVTTYTFTNIQANHTIEATFVQLTYTVTVTASGNGTISYGTATVAANTTQTFVVNCGENPLFTFHPANGYQVTSVEVNGVNVGTLTSYQFTNLSANATLNVTFGGGAAQTYTITATAGLGGTISPSGTQTYEAGDSQNYTITPDNCFRILDVVVDGVSVGPVTNYNFANISDNHTINATFQAITYTITVTAGAGGSIDFNGVIIPENSTQQFTIDCGATPTFNFIPNSGKQVIDVLLNGSSVGSPTSYQFQPLNGDATLEVVFGEGSAISQYEQKISIIPNPTRHYINIEAPNFTSIEIINYLGQMMYSTILDQGKATVDVKEFSNGIYFVRLCGENGIITKKIIKE